jgi:hypothetical protein
LFLYNDYFFVLNRSIYINFLDYLNRSLDNDFFFNDYLNWNMFDYLYLDLLDYFHLDWLLLNNHFFYWNLDCFMNNNLNRCFNNDWLIDIDHFLYYFFNFNNFFHNNFFNNLFRLFDKYFNRKNLWHLDDINFLFNVDWFVNIYLNWQYFRHYFHRYLSLNDLLHYHLFFDDDLLRNFKWNQLELYYWNLDLYCFVYVDNFFDRDLD